MSFGLRGGHTDMTAGVRLSFLGRELPSAFVLRTVVVAPGARRPYVEAEWRDAIVVVERGQIELEDPAGMSWCLVRGSVFWLSGLPVRALHNRRRKPAVLAAVSRRRLTGPAASSTMSGMVASALTVQVRVAGRLRGGPPRRALRLAPGATVADVLAALGPEVGVAPGALAGVAVAVDGEVVDHARALRDGEALDVVLPVAGGA
jgi:sulfur carrier protein ThiS